MERITTNKCANKIVKVERWLMRRNGCDWEGIAAEQLPDGRWLCEIEIPGLNIKPRAICKTEANAMLRAADKAYAVIKEYLHNNMSEQKTIESIRNWEIEIGENGEYVSMHLSKKQREREGKLIFEASKKTMDAIGKAIEKIRKINGSTKDLILEVSDKSNFSKSMNDHEILNAFTSSIGEKYKHPICGCATFKDDLVVYVGYMIKGDEA